MYAKTGDITAVVQQTLTNSKDIAKDLHLTAEYSVGQEGSALTAGMADTVGKEERVMV